MKHLARLFLSVAVFAALAAGLPTGCATQDAASVDVADKDIVASVQDRLRDDGITQRNIFGVESSQGIVTLTGVVPNELVRARALNIAEGTPGVKGVVDNLTR